MFFKGSRYEFVETNRITAPDGREFVYKKTRFITEPPVSKQHLVADGDRIDLIAQLYLRDPLLFWKVCDTNVAMWPPDLIAVNGKKIDIPSAQD